ncbi:MAG: D-alanine--D-alanine ligase family protein [Legionellaceae bacterium]|nr:D-alanine--D-alanine ligase family protein [Legionellaceae bacterium]
MKRRLAILYGGKSGEHEISLRSAAWVFRHLDKEKYDISLIAIDKEGVCYQQANEDVAHFPDALPINKSKLLPGLLCNGKFGVDVEVVFPVMHGPLCEDGAIQGLLKLADVAFVGSEVLSSAMCMDKDITRRIVCHDEVQSTPYTMISWHHSRAEREQLALDSAKRLGYPLFVKPCCLGSSVGIHKVHEESQLMQAVEDALRYDETILLEAFVPAREIELAVLENENPSQPPYVSVPGEVKVHHQEGFYSYRAKYIDNDGAELLIPAVLDESIVQKVQSMAASIFTQLKCKGMARVDFFLRTSDSHIYFNEINTIPGFTSGSLYPKLWAHSGIPNASLLDKLIELALIHKRCHDQLVKNYA